MIITSDRARPSRLSSSTCSSKPTTTARSRRVTFANNSPPRPTWTCESFKSGFRIDALRRRGWKKTPGVDGRPPTIITASATTTLTRPVQCHPRLCPPRPRPLPRRLPRPLTSETATAASFRSVRRRVWATSQWRREKASWRCREPALRRPKKRVARVGRRPRASAEIQNRTLIDMTTEAATKTKKTFHSKVIQQKKRFFLKFFWSFALNRNWH